MSLDAETVLWYRNKAQREVFRLTEQLRKDQPEEATRMLRARIKAMEELATWKPDSTSTDEGTNFL